MSDPFITKINIAQSQDLEADIKETMRSQAILNRKLISSFETNGFVVLIFDSNN